MCSPARELVYLRREALTDVDPFALGLNLVTEVGGACLLGCAATWSEGKDENQREGAEPDRCRSHSEHQVSGPRAV